MPFIMKGIKGVRCTKPAVHPCSKQAKHEQQVSLSSKNSYLLLVTYFSKTLPRRSYHNSATSWGPSIQAHKEHFIFKPLKPPESLPLCHTIMSCPVRAGHRRQLSDYKAWTHDKRGKLVSSVKLHANIALFWKRTSRKHNCL